MTVYLRASSRVPRGQQVRWLEKGPGQKLCGIPTLKNVLGFMGPPPGLQRSSGQGLASKRDAWPASPVSLAAPEPAAAPPGVPTAG